jgi:hypothetical protein
MTDKWLIEKRSSEEINELIQTFLVNVFYKLNSVAFSPQGNYTDQATAACRRS